MNLHFDAIGYVAPAEFACGAGPFPGLYDVTLDNGESFRDLTQPQLLSLARQRNLDLRPASSGKGREE